MKKQHWKAMGVAVLAAGLLAAGKATAGSLDPTNAPGPTMHTLEEIYQKLEAGTFTMTVTNIITVTNTVSVFTNAPVAKTGQTISYRIEDDGDLEKGVTWPSPRFTVQANTNVILDNLTGLMWARNANREGAKSWYNAIDYCRSLSLGGYDDWRLPNLREMQSLADYRQFDPPLPSGHPFTGVQWAAYWTSTTYAENTGGAWYVFLDDGGAAAYYKTDTYYVWPVRGGQ